MAFFAAFGVVVPTASQASASWKALRWMTQRFPGSYTEISTVQQKHETRITFPLGKATPPRRGEEMLVLHKEPGVPVILQKQAAVIRVETVAGSQVVAQEMAVLEGPSRIGDPVVVPASPVVYLYTNVKSKETFGPYTDLLNALLEKNFEVVELFEPRVEPRTDRYGVLVRLEGGEGHLTLRIQSIYSGDTLFFETRPYPRKFAALHPVGQKIALPDWTAALGRARSTSSAVFTQTQAPAGSFRKAQAVPTKTLYPLNEDIKRVVVCDVDGDGSQEIAGLADDAIHLYQLSADGIRLRTSYPLPGGPYVALHLHAMDITGDRGDELILTLGKQVMGEGREDTELHSMILSYSQGRFAPIERDLPYFLRVIQDRQGRLVLIGQQKGKAELYTGDIITFDWFKGSLFAGNEYRPAHNIYSVYQFNLIPEDPKRVMILEPSNELQVYYTPTEEPEVSSDKNYGVYAEIPFLIAPKKEKYIGGFTKKTHETAFAPRRFVLKRKYDDQMFLISKGRSGSSLGVRVGSLVNRPEGEDHLAAVKWSKGQIVETWKSEEIAKNILDFGFLKDPHRERLVVLVRDRQGRTALELIQ